MSQVVFNTNLEAELLGECVPKPELGNEDSRLSPQQSQLHSAKVLQKESNSVQALLVPKLGRILHELP